MDNNDLLNDIKSKFKSLLNARSLTISNDENLLNYLLIKSKFKEIYKDRFFNKFSFDGQIISIFKQQDFLTFLDTRLLGNGYTAYSNKIGLANKINKFIKVNEEVVLNFPFKDGIIKGSQSQDDEKLNEIFFNNIIDKNEIDILFSKKILYDFELISNNNIDLHKIFGGGGGGRPNLLIKGNNLLALHSLKDKYANKVKLIYIDPPYNTGNDSFNYNDRFFHSTWLTFIKNRLEIAREFLKDDGVIFVQCDDNEQAYLKVLMDEIFKRENFIANIIWLKGNAQNDAKTIQRNQEYILCYAKKLETLPIYKISQKAKVKVFKDEKTGKFYYEGAGLAMGGGDGGSLENRPNLGYTIYYNPSNKDLKALIDYDKTKVKIIKNSSIYKDVASLIEQGYEPIRPPKMGSENGRWKWALEKFETEKDRILIKKTNTSYSVIQKKWVEAKAVKSDENEKFYAILDKQSPPKSFIDDVGSGSGTTELKNIFNNKVFSSPKPETLLKHIIEISTQENDLVMDFFAGSGTTLAVAHKMNRAWIGIEQMDYIESVTKERLRKVISGEQGGISKALNWQGDGSFVYAKLMPLNLIFKEKIANAKDENELNKIYDELKIKAFLHYRVELEKFKDDEFNSLNLEDKKLNLYEIMDKNMDYVLYDDIDNTDYNINENTKKLNKIFYGEE